MSYVVKVNMREQNNHVPFENLENTASRVFWDKTGISSEHPEQPNKLYKTAELELDTQPRILADIERASNNMQSGLGIYISTISELGITLHVQYYPYAHDDDALIPSEANIFIPMSRVISINDNPDLAVLAYTNQSLLRGDVKEIAKQTAK